MPMNKKQRFIFIYLLMNTVMCVSMSIAAPIVNTGHLTFTIFLVSLLESLVICNLSTVILRLPVIGEKLTMLLSGGDPASKAFGIWSAVVNATLNTICMNFFMTLINVGFRPEVFPAFLRGLPILEVVSVAVSLVVSPVAMKFAMKAGAEKGPAAE